MKKTILFQGDSITDSCRRNEWGSNIGFGYATLVAGALGLAEPYQYDFINKGVSGNRIVDLYARWKVDGLNLKPDLISILIGVNDTWHGLHENENGVEVERAERIYRELLQWTKQVLPDVKLVLMEPFYLDTGTFPQEGIEDVAKRAVFTKKLAEEFGATFIPCQSLLNEKLKLAEAKYWLRDGVHPSPAGHQVLTDAWIAAVKDLLD